MQLTVISVMLVFTALLNLWIGFYVYQRGPHAGQNRAFALMAISTSIWTMALGFVHYGDLNHTWALRCAFVAANLVALGILAFIERLPVPGHGPSELGTTTFTPITLGLSVLSLTPWIVDSVTLDASAPMVVYGPMYYLFMVYPTVWFPYSICVLARKYRCSSGALRLQIRYLILALAFPSALVIVTNLLVPVLFRTSALSKYGPFFSLLLLALIGHAIIRHRLMDMRVVIRRSVVYLAAFIAAGLILITLLVTSNWVFHEQHRTPIRELVLALAVAVFFSPLKAQIQRAFDRYLYREPYDFQGTIREASRALGETIDRSQLLAYIIGLVDQTLKCESAAIYLLEDDESTYELALTRGQQLLPPHLALESSLVRTTTQSRDTVFRDELDGRTAPHEAEVLMEMDRLNAEVVVPLFEEQQVIGLLCLGLKRSGDPYFSNDADLLTTLANQAAVAIRNAQTHQRVVQMNEELQKILSTIESGVIAIGAKGRITLFNRAAELLTGVRAQSAPGQAIDSLPAPLAQLIAATAQDGQSRSQVEFSLPDAAGQLLPLVCSTSPLQGRRGLPAGAVAVIADLSRLKELEQEKRRAERLASLEAIASGMVHEIRNPLVAIKTFTQLLPVRFADEEFRETFSRVADREIRRIDDLLTRFRTLASASAQSMGPIDISAPLRDTLETLRPMFEQHRVQLRRVADGMPRPIVGNASQLEQLFLNLCLNSIEAMEGGGELTVRVADLSEGGGTTLLVEFSDTGCGIPDEMLPKIFNPFVTSKAHGTGLGLAICRSITDAHHARLSARNNLGRPGCTFTIEFAVPVGGGARVAT